MSLERFDVAPRLSQAVKAGGLVFTAGVFAADASQDVKGQTRQVLDKIDDLLSRAGTDKTKLASATIYIPDMALFADMNSVWDAWVAPGCSPARACVEAKLANPDWLVEIAVVAEL